MGFAVIERRPDVLNVLIGINDLWTQHAGSECLPYAVYPNEYEFTYRLLLSAAKEKCGCKFVLIEPFMFCSDPQNPMFKDLRRYIAVVHKLERDLNAVLLRLQSRIDMEIVQTNQEKWSSDMVHPDTWTHAWIAQQWLEATGL